MVETNATSPPPPFVPPRRSAALSPPPGLRQRGPVRAATLADLSSYTPPPSAQSQRRGSFMTAGSAASERPSSVAPSMDDLLLPGMGRRGVGATTQTAEPPSHLHSAPLVLALLPAIGGILFENGSAIATDLTLLALAAVFLNWSLRLPWHWYHSAQSIRIQEEAKSKSAGDYFSYSPPAENTTLVEESEEDGEKQEKDGEPHEINGNATSPTRSPGLSRSQEPSIPKARSTSEAAAEAASELRLYELLALCSCFICPILGAWLLHAIRSQLSRPQQGLVSDYNLSIFLLAAEVRPLSHLLSLIQARTVYLQRIVAENPHTQDLPGSRTNTDTMIPDLKARIDELEAHLNSKASSPETSQQQAQPFTQPFHQQQTQQIMSFARSALQPDLDAISRAVRRYEKRATVLGMQTEKRLSDLDVRVRDALALAAAAERRSAASSSRGSVFAGFLNFVASIFALPLKAAGLVFGIPISIWAWLADNVNWALSRWGRNNGGRFLGSKSLNSGTGKGKVVPRERDKDRDTGYVPGVGIAPVRRKKAAQPILARREGTL